MSDPSILLNWNTPFNDQKVFMLDQVINAMYQGSNQEVLSSLNFSLESDGQQPSK